jgi:hypothetical protein
VIFHWKVFAFVVLGTLAISVFVNGFTRVAFRLESVGIDRAWSMLVLLLIIGAVVAFA